MKRHRPLTHAAILIASTLVLSAASRQKSAARPAPPPPKPAPQTQGAQTKTQRPTVNGQATPRPQQNVPQARGTQRPAVAQPQRPVNVPPRPMNNLPNNNAWRPNANPPHPPVAPNGMSGRLPNGVTSRPFNGGIVNTRPDGSIHSVQARGMLITHGTDGARTIVATRPGGAKVVVNRAGEGYVQGRTFAYAGGVYTTRTYFVNHQTYALYYRPFAYHGVAMQVYAPRVYFSPAFYGWAYRPWRAPVAFNFGWAGSPWFGFYGPVFAPYPMYGGPVQWMTDYLVADSLAAAYQQRNPNGPPPSGPPMSPEVKGYIGNEMQRDIALGNEEAKNGGNMDPGAGSIDRTLSDGKPHVFVADASLDVVDAGGSECALSQGDAVQFMPPPPGPASVAVNVHVLWSRGQDCRIGSNITLGMENLQEMQNYMRATADRALAELNQQQGRNGLPPTQPDVNTNATPARYAQLAPPPDQNVQATLQNELGAADQVEATANARQMP